LSINKNPIGQILRGSGWSVLLRSGIRGIGLVSTVIMARLLAPEDFALITMAMLPIAFLTFVTDIGTGNYLIRVEKADREICDSAWTMRIIQGTGIAAAIMILAPWVADYFRDDRLLILLYWLSAVPLLKGFESVGTSLLLREGKFGREFQYRIVARLLSFVATMILAFQLRSYWAIAYGLIIGTLIEVILSFFWHPYRPRFSLSNCRRMFSFSLVLMARSLGLFCYDRCDIVILGRLVSAHFLGLYQVSIDLVAHISDEMSGAVSRGTYPAFAQRARSGEPIGPVLCQSLATVMLVCMPLGFGLSATAADFVDVVLGAKWADAAPLVAWLALFGPVKAANGLMSGGCLIAIHREGASARLAWLRFAIRAPAVVAALLLWDIHVVAIAVLVSECVSLAATSVLIPKIAGVPLGSLVSCSWRSVFASVAMALSIQFVLAPNLVGLPSSVRLLAQVALGAFLYLGVLTIVSQLWRSKDVCEYDILRAVATKAASLLVRPRGGSL
jgi:lipopolysaccharide exporter